MEEPIRCKNCRSQKWEKVGTVMDRAGRGYIQKTLYQCVFCKRIIMLEGEIPKTSDPLVVI